MTMIELGVVMSIVAVLFALVLGLGRHVNEVVKIRRAQAELGEWHEVMDHWYRQFGEYPYGAIDVNGNVERALDPAAPGMNFSNILTHARVELARNDSGGITNITFRSFCASGTSQIDPWGTPYIYTSDESRKTYELYSCGPDARTRVNGTQYPSGTSTTLDPTLDDIYFEQ